MNAIRKAANVLNIEAYYDFAEEIGALRRKERKREEKNKGS